MSESIKTFRRLANITKPFAGGYVVATIALIVAAATEPAFPALMKYILDEGFEKSADFPIWAVSGAIVGIFLVRGIATFSSQYALSWVAQKSLVELRSRMFEKLLKLPAANFEKEAAGVLISRLVFEVHNVLESISSVLTTAVRDTFVIIGLMSWLFWLNWKLTLVALVLIASLAVALSLFGKRMRRLSRKSLETTAELTQVVEEAVHGYKVIKIFGAFQREQSKFRSTIERLRGFFMRMTIASAVTTPITQLMSAVAVAIVVNIALYESRSGEITVGGFASFITAMLMLMAPMKRFADITAPFHRGLAAAEKVFELLDREIEANQGVVEVERVKGEIRFENVFFRYPSNDTDALSGISLSIQPGEMIAIVGESGGGKTTLLNLLPRFISPTSGRILLDGIPISELTLESLRSQMSLVSQEIVLFNETVRANVAYGARKEVSDEEINQALDAAAIGDFVRSLPSGIDTSVGERGGTLSGGQRQRLALARAILSGRPILLLDEATSALDTETERKVQLALAATIRGKTTIVIAHRLSTIREADKIIVLEQGRIVAFGTHQTLIEESKEYAKLYNAAMHSAKN
jgi:subfamily B ATP-binding cassette protein MsbA